MFCIFMTSILLWGKSNLSLNLYNNQLNTNTALLNNKKVVLQRPTQNTFKGYNNYNSIKRTALKTFKKNKPNKFFELIQDPTMRLLTVNLVSIVAMRVLVDSFRNKFAALETALYEVLSTVVNYGLPSISALAAAVSLGLIPSVNPHKINLRAWIDNKSVEKLGKIYKSKKNPQDFAAHILNNTSIYNGEKDISIKDLKIDTGKHVNYISKLIKSTPEDFKANKKSYKKQLALIVKDIGEKAGGTDKATCGELKTSLGKLLENTVYIGREFHHKTGNDASKMESIISTMKNVNIGKSLFSLGLVCACGFSVQFLVRFITKKITGKDEYVGYKDFNKDLQKDNTKTPENSTNNTSNTINSNPSFKGRMPDLISSGPLPTENQLKYAIYPIGGLGTFLASRDWNEFWDRFRKFTFVFLNFLIIPNLIANLTAKSFKNEHVFNNKPVQSTKNITGLTGIKKIAAEMKNKIQGSAFYKKFNNINSAGIKSYSDIEAYSAFKANEYFKNNNLDLKEFKKSGLLSDYSKVKPNITKESLIKEISKELKGIKNVSTFAGILYSCLTIGIALNVLNIIITNHKREKQLKAMSEKQNANQPDNTSFNANVMSKKIKDSSGQLFSSFMGNI